jgi:hypothetical protein
MRKKTWTRLAASILAASVLGGCATSGLKYSDMASDSPRLRSGFGRIYFYRSGIPLGLAVQPDININGAKVGSAVPNGYFFVDRPPGKYELSAKTEIEEKVPITLQAGETKYVQFYLTPGILLPHANLNPVTREKAEQDMAELRQVEAQ